MDKLDKSMQDAVWNGLSNNGISQRAVEIAKDLARAAWWAAKTDKKNVSFDEWLATYNSTADLRTSHEWQKDAEFKYIQIVDPDGWDRKNFGYSWHEEKISLEEFKLRLSKSTVMGYTPTGEPRWSPHRNG